MLPVQTLLGAVFRPVLTCVSPVWTLLGTVFRPVLTCVSPVWTLLGAVFQPVLTCVPPVWTLLGAVFRPVSTLFYTNLPFQVRYADGYAGGVVDGIQAKVAQGAS